jgi:hypothetical protein
LAAERGDKANAFPLVSVYVVGATGFEPVTSSVSANSGEALCSTPLLEVAVNRRPEVLFLPLWLGLGACLEFDEAAPS